MPNFLSYHRFYHQYKAFTTHLSSNSVPKNVQEALSDPRGKEAINEEMKTLCKSETWDIIDLPKEKKKSVGCKWVFTIKYKVDASIERHKPRLVAKGYTQT